MTAAAAPARPHTPASLAAQLRALGLRPGAIVLVHAALHPLGFLEGVDLTAEGVR